MSWQLTVTLMFVALACGYLARRGWRTWRGMKGGCGGCSCPKNEDALPPLQQLGMRNHSENF